MNLIINDLIINDLAVFNLIQSYSHSSDGVIYPMSDGSSIKVSPDHGDKLTTTISGSGICPAAIDGLDYSVDMIIDCMQQRSISSASNAITIPGIIRPDQAPEGFAVVDGVPVLTNSSMIENVITIDVVAGNQGYIAAWLPRLTMLCSKPDQSKDITGKEYSWSLTGIETTAQI